MSEYDHHLRLVGILHLVWAGLAMVGVGAAALLIAAIGLLPGLIDEVWLPLAVTATVAAALAAVILLFFLPSLIGGIGILRGRPWARPWLTIAAVLNLVVFPLGTLLGAYTLWATWPRTPAEISVTGA